MTEFNPFSSGEQADAFAPDQPEQEHSEGSKRTLGIALGALAAVLVAGGAFLFLGGGDDEELAPVARSPRAAAPAVSPTPAAKLPVKSTITLGRNPFRALYVEPAPEPAPEEAATPGPAGGLDSGGAPIVLVPGGGTPPGGTPPGGAAPAPAPQEPTAKEHKLVLLRVFGTGKDQSAAFSIDGKQQTAKVGTTFGPTAELLLLSLQEGPKEGQWTAVIQVGDGDPFDVIQGDPVFVR